MLAIIVLATGMPNQVGTGPGTNTGPGSIGNGLGRFGSGGAQCDPTAGYIRYRTTVYLASNFTTCGPSSGLYYEPGFSIQGSSSTAITDFRGGGPRDLIPGGGSDSPSFSGVTCDAGYQCIPTATDCSTGVCESCEYGKTCPNGTSNRFASADYNVCPAGYNCPDPAADIEDCAAGYFCLESTYDGGYACPDTSEGSSGVHSWGYTLYCPANSYETSTCPNGYLCTNSSTLGICPEGHYCKAGANESIPCLTDWFGSSSAASRCPAGSSSEPERWELVFMPLIAWIIAFCIIEYAVAACTKRRVSIAAILADANPAAPTEKASRPTATTEGTDAGDQTCYVAGAKNTGTNSKWIQSFDRVFAVGAFQRAAMGAVHPKPRAAGIGPDLMKLTFKDVSFKIGTNQVLNGVRATLRHGQLIALMGESGSGKTTLLNVIAGRASYGTCTGEISFNGKPFDPQSISLGFVPQAYLVFKELTVYENVTHTTPPSSSCCHVLLPSPALPPPRSSICENVTHAHRARQHAIPALTVFSCLLIARVP